MTTQSQIKKLLAVYSKEQIAVRFKVSTRTVERWRDGESAPHRREEQKIERIIKRLTSEEEKQ